MVHQTLDLNFVYQSDRLSCFNLKFSKLMASFIYSPWGIFRLDNLDHERGASGFNLVFVVNICVLKCSKKCQELAWLHHTVIQTPMYQERRSGKTKMNPSQLQINFKLDVRF